MKSIKFFYKNLYSRLVLAFLVSLATTFLILDFTAPRIPILGFHSINNIQNPNERPFLKSAFKGMNYQRQDFETVLNHLILHKFWFVSTADMYDYFITKSKPIPVERIGHKPIMLSFDDGYKTNYTDLLYSLERAEKNMVKKLR